MPKSIALYWGNKATRTSTLESNSEAASEGNCSLTFSQSVRGDVICIMYPFKSQLHKRSEDYLILSRFHHPSWYNREDIIRFVQYFFSYSQVSSFIGNPDTIDIWRIRRLRCYSWYIQTTLPGATKIILKSLIPIIPKLLVASLPPHACGAHTPASPGNLPLSVYRP